MAFITNQKQDGAKRLGDRLGELMGHSARLDMLVGFFFFSGVKVLYDALKARVNMTLRVLVGMEAEFAMGQFVESLRKSDDNSANAIKARFLESMRKIVGSGEVDTKAFHERLDLFVGLLESGRLELRKTRDPNHAKLYIFNFFPTVKGSTVVNNREIAQTKMFAIHRILGEDAQIFSLEEEPSASALYDKLSKLDDESETSFYAGEARIRAGAEIPREGASRNPRAHQRIPEPGQDGVGERQDAAARDAHVQTARGDVLGGRPLEDGQRDFRVDAAGCDRADRLQVRHAA